MTDPDARTGLPLWASLTGPELRELAQRDPLAVLPMAAVEQHGPHLPLSTDVDIGMGILREAARGGLDPRVVVLPGMAVGSSPEHLGFAGTLSLTPGTADAALVETGASLAASGVRRLVVVNSHGGNKSVLDSAALHLRREHGMLVVKASWFRFPRPETPAGDPAVPPIPDTEWEDGLHGGAVETAMMLHLHPDRVRRGELRDFPSRGRTLAASLKHVRPEGAAPFAWIAEDLNPHGVTGDATLATPELGAALVAHYGRVLRQVLDDALRFPLNTLHRS
jgi:creatinine amidohydrolase